MKRTVSHARSKMLAVPALLLVLAAACLPGCAVFGERQVFEEQFTAKQVRAIRNGETTKKEILEQFGPPLAVARPGATVQIPRHGLVTTGSRDVPADSVFSRFPEAAGGRENFVVYYYRGSALSWADVAIYDPSFHGATFRTQPILEVAELWVLVDEKERRVANHQAELTEWEVCVTRECRDDDEPSRPKKKAPERAATREDSGQPWEGSP